MQIQTSLKSTSTGSKKNQNSNVVGIMVHSMLIMGVNGKEFRLNLDDDDQERLSINFIRENYYLLLTVNND